MVSILPPVRGTAISEEQKLEFLDYVRQGYIRPEAAKKVSPNLNGSQFRRLCNPESVHYDERFARIYKQIIDSGEHDENRLEQLRSAALKRALVESDRLLEKLLLIYDPDWEPLRTQRVDINANMETFVHQHFGHLTAAQIRQILEWVKENGTENIIDVIPSRKELEPAKDEEAA